ncbi:hypothetical protein J4455_04230 [Candidatus Woesearchaeota archaeon]|nr:hypothetical protein [Candidatus Woesearchaeota archaeon]
MLKRGQVTIFIILGLIIVIIIGFVYFQRTNKVDTTEDTESNERFVTSQIEPVKKLVVDCVDKESLKGLRLIGKQGGYYKPIKYKLVGDYKIAYGCYINNGERINNLPLLKSISKEFDDYMNSDSTQNEISKCIDEFKFFEESGIKVSDGNLIVTSDIKYNKVAININYPLTISKGDYSANVDSMFSEIFIGLGKLHKVASDIINEECTGNSFDVDKYIRDNEPLATIGMQYSLGDTFVYLSSITEAKEEPIDFHFVIQNGQ